MVQELTSRTHKGRRAIGALAVVGLLASAGFASVATAAGEGSVESAVPAVYKGVTPQRIVDTRIGLGAPKAPMAAGGTLAITVTGVAGVPSNATAVVLNVTAVNGSASSYLTMWAAGNGRPNTANLNWNKGDTVANLVTVAHRTGVVTAFNYAGTLDLVIDIVGYYQPLEAYSKDEMDEILAESNAAFMAMLSSTDELMAAHGDELSALKALASGTDADVEEIFGLLEYKGSLIWQLQQDIAAINSALDELVVSPGGNEDDIAELQADVMALELLLAELQTTKADQSALDDLAAALQALESVVEAHSLDIEGLETDLSALRDDLDSLSITVDQLGWDLEALGLEVDDLFTLFGALSDHVDWLEGQHYELHDLVLYLQGDQEALAMAHEALAGDVDALTQLVSDQGDAIDAILSDLADGVGTIEVIYGDPVDVNAETEAIAICEAGGKAMGGGFAFDGVGAPSVLASFPEGEDAWRVRFTVTGADPSDTMNSYVVCFQL